MFVSHEHICRLLHLRSASSSWLFWLVLASRIIITPMRSIAVFRQYSVRIPAFYGAGCIFSTVNLIYVVRVPRTIFPDASTTLTSRFVPRFRARVSASPCSPLICSEFSFFSLNFFFFFFYSKNSIIRSSWGKG